MDSAGEGVVRGDRRAIGSGAEGDGKIAGSCDFDAVEGAVSGKIDGTAGTRRRGEAAGQNARGAIEERPPFDEVIGDVERAAVADFGNGPTGRHALFKRVN